MAGPGQLDLNVFEGDDFAIQLLFQHPDGSPFDFSGAEWEAVITKGNWSDEAVVALAVDASGATAGQLVLQLVHAATETLVRRGEWRLTEIEPGGDRHTLLAGKVKRTNDAATGQNAVTVTVGPETVTVVTTQAIGVSALLAETQQRIEADVEEASAREEADAAHAAADPAHSASHVSVTPGSGVVSDNAQDAIAEITGFITSQEAGDSAAIAAEVAGRISGDIASRARANHTGTQLAATISDFAAAVNGVALLRQPIDIVQRGVTPATDPTTNADAISALIAEAGSRGIVVPDLDGDEIVIVEPIVVSAASQRVMGMGEGSLIRQSTPWLPGFDNNLNDRVVFEDLFLLSTEAYDLTGIPGGSFRGTLKWSYWSAIWSSGQSCKFNRVRSDGFFVGIHLSDWDGAHTSSDGGTLKYGNEIDHLEADHTNMGILARGQEAFDIGFVKGSYMKFTNPVPFPAHLIYLSEGNGTSHRDGHLHHCTAKHGRGGRAFSNRGLVGCTVESLTAYDCTGLLTISAGEGSVWDGIVGFGDIGTDDPTLGEEDGDPEPGAAVKIQLGRASTRHTVKGLVLSTSSDQAINCSGDYCTLVNPKVTINRATDGDPANEVININGTQNRVLDPEVYFVGGGTGVGIRMGGAAAGEESLRAHLIRNPKVVGGNACVVVQPSAGVNVQAVLEWNPEEIQPAAGGVGVSVSLGSGGLGVVLKPKYHATTFAMNAALSTDPAATITIDALLQTHVIIDATTTTDFTIANALHAYKGYRLLMEIRNDSGGNLGNITFGNAWVFTDSFIAPLTGSIRLIEWVYDGVSKWRQIAPASERIGLATFTGNRNLADTDLGKHITASNAADATLTIVAGKGAGAVFDGHQGAAGRVTLAPGAGVTFVPSPYGYQTPVQGSKFSGLHLGGDVWLISVDA